MHSIATERDQQRQGRRIVRGRLAAAFSAVTVACGILAAIAFAGTQDRHGSYTCSAQVLDFPPLTTISGSPLLIQANPQNDPCENDSDSLGEDSEGRGKLLYASTAQRPEDLSETGESNIAPKAGDGADAKAGLAKLDIPFGDSGYRLRATAVQTHAYVRCHCAYPSRTFHPTIASKSTVKSFSISTTDGDILLSRTTATSSALKYDDGPGGLPFAVYLNRQQKGTQDEGGKWVSRSAIEIVSDNGSFPKVIVLPVKAGYEGNPCEFGSTA